MPVDDLVKELAQEVMSVIFKGRREGQRVVSFPFTGRCPPYVVSDTIQSTLHELGYVTFVLMSGGKSTRDIETLYVDLVRSDVSGSQANAKG